MRVLELGAIDLDAGMRIAEQRLGHGFHHASLSRAGRPQEKQVAHRTARSVQPGQEHLVNFSDLFDGLVLTDNAAAQCGFKFSSVGAAAVRIEHGSEVRSHKIVVCPACVSRTLQFWLPCDSPVPSECSE